MCQLYEKTSNAKVSKNVKEKIGLFYCKQFYLKITIFLNVGVTNDFFTSWFIGKQTTIHNQKKQCCNATYNIPLPTWKCHNIAVPHRICLNLEFICNIHSNPISVSFKFNTRDLVFSGYAFWYRFLSWWHLESNIKSNEY